MAAAGKNRISQVGISSRRAFNSKEDLLTNHDRS